MSGEMGELSAHMKGTVLKGAVVEAVLAAVPEQVWMWEEGENIMGVELVVEVPMKQRREIVAHVLLAAGLGE